MQTCTLALLTRSLGLDPAMRQGAFDPVMRQGAFDSELAT